MGAKIKVFKAIHKIANRDQHVSYNIKHLIMILYTTYLDYITIGAMDLIERPLKSLYCFFMCASLADWTLLPVTMTTVLLVVSLRVMGAGGQHASMQR